ncbi:MAG: hypothetical protein HOE26_01275 [Rhodospirillaceae bacterium]|nr:hypothetical protein [Rhodospirillaceae bacterium]
MTGISIAQETTTNHPLDIIERLGDDNDWIFDRRSEQEMAVQAPGRWCDYSMFFAWNDAAGAMHFTCAFDMRVPENRRERIHELLALINEKLWLGHFGIWNDEGLPMFSHSLPFRGTKGPNIAQMEDVVETALLECERFYPAFQHAIWGGKSATESIAAAMIDTVGEA